MASIGLSGSATYSETLSGIEQMMTVLPDNTANQITARDVRDVVFTLYQDIVGVSASVVALSLGNSASNIDYFNSSQSIVTVGGLTAGTTFSSISLQDLLDSMLYPYVAPELSLTASPSTLEYGNTQSVSLTYGLTKQKNTLQSGIIYRPMESPYNIPSLPTNLFGFTSGVISAKPKPNITSSFTFSVNDFNAGDGSGSTNNNQIAQIDFQNKRYWGSLGTSSITSSSQILGLTGAGVGSGNELATTYIQSRDGINGDGKYLIFAWPTSFGNNPTFICNGMVSTAFTKVNSNWTFTNIFGYTASYDVWSSDTIQYSPILKFEIN